MHAVVGLAHAVLVDVEGVGILHDELAGSHDPEARPDFVPEFRLDLVIVDGQLLVAAQLAAGDVGDDFLVRRAETELALVPVVHAQQQRAVLVPATGLLPQFGRLHCRHQQFERAGTVHLLADHFFHLAQDSEAQRHPGEQARGEPANQPGSKHQLVADDLRLSGDFLERR